MKINTQKVIACKTLVKRIDHVGPFENIQAAFKWIDEETAAHDSPYVQYSILPLIGP